MLGVPIGFEIGIDLAVDHEHTGCALGNPGLQRLQIGESVVISLQARIDNIAAATTFTNKAFVTTADDPACQGEGCVPPCVSPVRVEADIDAVDEALAGIFSRA